MEKAPKAIPDGYHTITAQLTLDNAAQTIEWYKKALGAEELGRHLSLDGKVAHAELRIGDSRLMVNDVMTGKGPKAHGGSPAMLWIDASGRFRSKQDRPGRVGSRASLCFCSIYKKGRVLERSATGVPALAGGPQGQAKGPEQRV